MREIRAANVAEFVNAAVTTRRELIVHPGDLPATAVALRDLLAASGQLFDRGMLPVRVVMRADRGAPSVTRLTRHNVVMEAHRLCEPVRLGADGTRKAVTLPDRVAQMYLDMFGEWNLRPLAGVSTAPLLSSDGSVRAADGYDSSTTLWCCNVPKLTLPARPSHADAQAALRLLREAFRTFPYSDAARRRDAILGVEVVDITKPPGADESAFLLGLLTAVCRASLWLAPGFLFTAPAVSGAGSGKGLLVRAICTIAFGTAPRAFTTGGERHELDKRLAAELVEAQPALFLDNVNGVALHSDTLASVLTERPASVRILGETRMVPLNSVAFVAVTGNGLTVTEDLARRFIVCELDARCEDPESRPFPAGFLDQVQGRRAQLLAAVLTIWRWGRQNAAKLARGKPLGSFETWGDWCRDPLVTLGCRDPVERIEQLKASDPRRQRVGDLYRVWWEHHSATPMKVNDLAEPVKTTADPQGRGRQYLATYIKSLTGTRVGGFVLTRQEPAGKWAAATYGLTPTDREHRPDSGQPADGQSRDGPDGSDESYANDDRGETVDPARASSAPVGPMGPMPHAIPNSEMLSGGAALEPAPEDSAEEEKPEPLDGIRHRTHRAISCHTPWRKRL
jgi:hypothetical protein